jgi:microcystin-dependent protein
MISVYTPPKTWAYKESLSSADMNLYVRDNTIALKELLPIGELIDLAYDGTPDGPYLHCDGTAVSRSTYAALFAKMGTTWGAGDGSTTFNLPDGRGRVKAGAGTGSGLTARTVGQLIGQETVDISHSHTYAGTTSVYTADVPTGGSSGANKGGSHSHTYSGTTSTDGNTTLTNIQPTYIVKTFIRYA